MALIAVSPFVLGDATLKIDSDNYETSVSNVTIDPNTSTVNFKGLTPAAVFNFPTAATWTVGITYAQDWANATSLSNYLFDNAGETVTAIFAPKNGGPSFTVDVTLVAGPIGGAVDAVATAQVTLQVVGAPSRSV